MLSVIVAVHNQIGHNQLFLEGIRKYTTGPYEVVVIDNHSTDGSAEFFESQGCRVIRNAVNLCYPESMNLGTRNSTGDYVCHINNDLYVGPNWNGRLIEAMERFRLDAITPLGLEMMPTPALTDWIQARWATIGQGRLSSGKTAAQLRDKIRAMYGDWEAFCSHVYRSFSEILFDGLNGSCVMIRRSTYDALGGLDELGPLLHASETRGRTRRCQTLQDFRRRLRASLYTSDRQRQAGAICLYTPPALDPRQMVARRTRTAMVQVQLFSAGIGKAFVCGAPAASRRQTAEKVDEGIRARPVLALAVRAP